MHINGQKNIYQKRKPKKSKRIIYKWAFEMRKGVINPLLQRKL